jgi:hypothetical protein
MCINWREAQNVYTYSKPRLTPYRLTLLRTYVVYLQAQYIKPKSQIRTYDAEEFFDLHKY